MFEADDYFQQLAQKPDLSSFEKALLDLKQKVDAAVIPTKVSIEDIPLQALQRKLAATWGPDASQFLLPGSITSDLLVTDLKYRTGAESFATDGVGAASVTFTHGLVVEPSSVNVILVGSSMTAVPYLVSKTATQATVSFAGGAGFTNYTFAWSVFP